MSYCYQIKMKMRLIMVNTSFYFTYRNTLINFMVTLFIRCKFTAWKVPKYGVISGPYFPAFGLNTERYEVSLRIQSECGKIRTRNNTVFGHFSRSDWNEQSFKYQPRLHLLRFQNFDFQDFLGSPHINWQ